MFEQFGGKEISYNNLWISMQQLNLIKEFDEPTVAILKHNNACGVALRSNVYEHGPMPWRAILFRLSGV